MGTSRVVSVAPGVEARLEILETVEDTMVVEQFDLKRLVEAFDLAGRGR
jgi:hypothetical protein